MTLMAAPVGVALLVDESAVGGGVESPLAFIASQFGGRGVAPTRLQGDPVGWEGKGR